RGSVGGRTAAYSPSTTNVTGGVSQSFAEKPWSPSSLSCGMFADLRNMNTAPAVSSPIASTLSVLCSPRSQSTAKRAAMRPLSTPVAAMWPVLKTDAVAAPSALIKRSSSQSDDPHAGGQADQRGLGDLDPSL